MIWSILFFYGIMYFLDFLSGVSVESTLFYVFVEIIRKKILSISFLFPSRFSALFFLICVQQSAIFSHFGPNFVELDYIIIATQMDYLHYLVPDHIGWNERGEGV